MEQDLRGVARLANDQQLFKDADSMRKYQDTLAKWVQNQTGRSPSPVEGAGLDQPIRGRRPLSTPKGPALELM